MRQSMCVMLLAWTAAAWLQSSASLDAQAPSGAIRACSLLTRAEVDTVTARRSFSDPEPTSLAGGAGSSCSFDSAQVVLFSGPKSEDLWNGLMKNFGHQDATRQPVSGLGDRAYAFSRRPGTGSRTSARSSS